MFIYYFMFFYWLLLLFLFFCLTILWLLMLLLYIIFMHVMYLISCVWFSTYFISIHVPMVYQYHITIHSAELCWNPESVRFIGPRFQPLRFRRWKKRNSESTRANGPCAAPPPPNWRIQAGWAASNVARIRHGPLQNTTCFTPITKKKTYQNH